MTFELSDCGIVKCVPLSADGKPIVEGMEAWSRNGEWHRIGKIKTGALLQGDGVIGMFRVCSTGGRDLVFWNLFADRQAAYDAGADHQRRGFAECERITSRGESAPPKAEVSA